MKNTPFEKSTIGRPERNLSDAHAHSSYADELPRNWRESILLRNNNIYSMKLKTSGRCTQSCQIVPNLANIG